MNFKYILDSNTVIDYLAGTLPKEGMLFIDSVVNDYPAISVITKIEVLGYNEKEESYKFIESFIADSATIGLNEDIVSQTILIRKTSRLKLPDAIIAATAIVHNCELITRDIHDFKSITNLKILNPWALA